MSTPRQNLDRLTAYVRESTVPYRVGEVVEAKANGTLTVVTINDFPELPDGLESTVDVHFIKVGFTEALASMSHQEFYDLVTASPHGHYSDMVTETWQSGPSYILIGRWIGDQTDALRFMAVAHAHGLGHVITPARLHIKDQAMADQMAGAGYVMLSGLDNPATEVIEHTGGQ